MDPTTTTNNNSNINNSIEDFLKLFDESFDWAMIGSDEQLPMEVPCPDALPLMAINSDCDDNDEQLRMEEPCPDALPLMAIDSDCDDEQLPHTSELITPFVSTDSLEASLADFNENDRRTFVALHVPLEYDDNSVDATGAGPAFPPPAATTLSSPGSTTVAGSVESSSSRSRKGKSPKRARRRSTSSTPSAPNSAYTPSTRTTKKKKDRRNRKRGLREQPIEVLNSMVESQREEIARHERARDAYLLALRRTNERYPPKK